MNFVGNQLGRATLKEERKSGKLRALIPSLSQDYYCSIPFTEKDQYGRQKLSKEIKTFIDITEVFLLMQEGVESSLFIDGINKKLSFKD